MKKMQKSLKHHVWQRETNDPDALYIDLFATLDGANQPNSFASSQPAQMTGKCKNLAKKYINAGNSEYNTRNYIDAMDSFNRSLQYVETTAADDIATIHIRRSDCFRSLKLYDKALVDVKTAESISGSNALLSQMNPKLDAFLSEEQQKSAYIQKPLVSHHNYPGLSECLGIFTDKTFGRQIVAKSSIDVGEVVINEQILFFATIATNTRCSYCFKERQNFIACPTCADAMFCNQNCLAHDQIHRTTCQTSFASFDLQLKIQVYAMLKILQLFDGVDELCNWIEMVRAESGNDLPNSVLDTRSMYHFYLKLQYHAELNEDVPYIIRYVYECLMNMPTIRIQFDTLKKCRFLQHLIGLHCQINATNGFSDGRNRWISIVTSLFNHSCAPNALWMNIDNRSVCVTLRPIERDEQLFINYIGNVDPMTKVRQDILSDTWHFLCQCERCEPIGKKHIAELMRDADFNQISMFLVCGYAEKEQRTTLKKCCEDVLKRFGRNTWSVELGTVITSYTAVLLHELRSFYWRNSNEPFFL